MPQGRGTRRPKSRRLSSDKRQLFRDFKLSRINYERSVEERQTCYLELRQIASEDLKNPAVQDAFIEASKRLIALTRASDEIEERTFDLAEATSRAMGRSTAEISLRRKERKRELHGRPA